MPNAEKIAAWREYFENKSDEDKAVSAEFTPTTFGERVSTDEKVSVSADGEGEKSEGPAEDENQVLSTSENTQDQEQSEEDAQAEQEQQNEAVLNEEPKRSTRRKSESNE